MESCPFCAPHGADVFFENELVLGIWNAFPVTEGHALLVTRRHVLDWFEATASEQQALALAVGQAREAVLAQHQPVGFNVGLNCGVAAGQTVFHLHLHVVPRYGEPMTPTGELSDLIPTGAKPDRYKPHLVTLEQQQAELSLVLERGAEVELAVADLLALELPLVPMLARGGQLNVWAINREPFSELQSAYPDQVELFITDRALPGACRVVERNGRESAFVGIGEPWAYRLIHGQDTRGLGEIRAAFLRGWPEIGSE